MMQHKENEQKSDTGKNPRESSTGCAWGSEEDEPIKERGKGWVERFMETQGKRKKKPVPWQLVIFLAANR